MFVEAIKAIIIGIVEGITEWLPISSTGHMIILDEFLKLKVSEEFLELFLVVIQLGAIMAVPLLFWDRLWPFSKKKSTEERQGTWQLWAKVIVGAIPAAVIGFLLDDLLDKYFYNFIVVSVALIVYGIAFLFIEGKNRESKVKFDDLSLLTYKDALKIGAFQVLSLIPGTSRSGSTILGGMLSGVSRKVSAEFSFFMAIPIMLGASGLKIVKFMFSGFNVTGGEIALLLIGMVVSFIVSVVAIRFLMDFVKKHSFKAFGYYRIALGALVLLFFIIKNV